MKLLTSTALSLLLHCPVFKIFQCFFGQWLNLLLVKMRGKQVYLPGFQQPESLPKLLE